MSAERKDYGEFLKLLGYDVRGAVNHQVLAGALVLPVNCAMLQRLDSGGSARNVDLPDAADSEGKVIIFHAPNGTGALTVRESVTDGGSTVVIVAVTKGALAYCMNGQWYGGTLG